MFHEFAELLYHIFQASGIEVFLLEPEAEIIGANIGDMLQGVGSLQFGFVRYCGFLGLHNQIMLG
ncbi:hypothetical protein C404_08465 [Ralstonia sp. AU12-08]|nr:hypothetical protein C404_08465 [Ralstonia sp. AU12-08]